MASRLTKTSLLNRVHIAGKVLCQASFMSNFDCYQLSFSRKSCELTIAVQEQQHGGTCVKRGEKDKTKIFSGLAAIR